MDGENNTLVDCHAKIDAPGPTTPESIRKCGRKSSPYKGVTLFRPTMKWRSQISASGKTTSLGDHETEADAARAFDRAAINKHGRGAKTNFPLSDYEEEIEALLALDQAQMVAMLRGKARKSIMQTSLYRGVSLLKQTHKWHAQINVCNKQVHLGFFPTEEDAARAYDRCAINKAARDGGKLATNMNVVEYQTELEILRRLSEPALVEAISHESKRPQTYKVLASGKLEEAEEYFGSNFDKNPDDSKIRSAHYLLTKAERCQPKSTQANPLYQQFQCKKEGVDIQSSSPILFPSPGRQISNARPTMRGQYKPRTLFVKEEDEDSSSTETDEETAQVEANQEMGPPRRSTRKRNKPAKKYEDFAEIELDDLKEGVQLDFKDIPTLSPSVRTFKAQSTKQKREEDSDEEESKQEKKRRKLKPVNVEPAELPTWELLAQAISGFQTKNNENRLSPRSHLEPSAMKVPSESPKIMSISQAGTLESKANTFNPEMSLQPPAPTDMSSKVFVDHPTIEDKASAVSVQGSPISSSEQITIALPDSLHTMARNLRGMHHPQSVFLADHQPILFGQNNTNGMNENLLREGLGSVASDILDGGFGRKGSNLAANFREQASRAEFGLDILRASQEESVRGTTPVAEIHKMSLPSKSGYTTTRTGRRIKHVAKRSSRKRALEEDAFEPSSNEEGNQYAKNFSAKPQTKRQKAMAKSRGILVVPEEEEEKNPDAQSPKASVAQFLPETFKREDWDGSYRSIRRLASQSSHQGLASPVSSPSALGGNSQGGIELPTQLRRNRRKFHKPLRAADH